MIEEHVTFDVTNEQSYSIDLDYHRSEDLISQGKQKKVKEEGKRSKLKRLLEKYDVKFLESDTGKATKSPKIICPICSKVLTLLSFSVHVKSHEGGRDFNFMCEICSKKCISNSELTVHRR